MTNAKLSIFTAVALSAVMSTNALSCADLRVGPTSTVVEVTDGDTIVLGNGMKVRMIGIQAPKLPLGRVGYETWPMADDAKSVLENLLYGATVQLRFAGEQQDRHGRVLAHVFVADEADTWAQKEMLKAGMARVYSFYDNRYCLDELYAAEAEARVERRGIWTDPYYALRAADRPDDILDRVGHYELVEGRVLNAEQSGSRVYLNFGRYWKEDFTVVLDRNAQKLFAQSGIDPLQYENQLVRVRGWIDDRDGPRMDVTHPEQIQVLAVR